MTTLEKLQGLDDSQFHQLADAILKRVEAKYRDLRTHGVNERGHSIKGQPDSYVGNSVRREKRLQAEIVAELDALLASIPDHAFKGKL